MVASYSKKKSKYTYAERVVGALSQIQREHKKHGVHLATLRAQVRRNAQDHREKLGPQWSNWVSRAVTKLEGQGVLESSSTNNVAFTAEAKKVLTTARRESVIKPSSLSRAGVSDSAEDLVWKQVAQTVFTRGTKRQRRRPSAVQSRYISDYEDDAPSASFSASARRRSVGAQKKARRQSTGKALSKMTRAELQAEVRSTQAQSTPEETLRLQEELEEARRQLVEAQEQLASPMRAMGGTRPHTPEPHTSLITAQTASKSGLRRGPLLGITRTESGSLINQYSKQPTPAPSSPGGHDFDMDEELPQSLVGGHDDVFSTRHGLATPSSSVPYNEYVRNLQAQRPDNDMSDHEDVNPGSPLTPLETRRELELENEVSANLKRIEDLQCELREQSELLTAKDAARATEHTRVEDLQQTVSDLEASLAEKDATIVGTKKLLSDAEALSFNVKSDLGVRRAQYENRLSELQVTMASYQVALEEEKQRACVLTEELVTQKSLAAKILGEKATLQVDYNVLQGELTGVYTKLDDALISVQDLTTRCTEAEDRNSQANSRMSELTEQATLLRAELSAVSTEKAQVTTENGALKLQLATTMAEVKAIEFKLATTITDLDRSRASETALEQKLSSLQEAHAADAVTLDMLRGQSNGFEATIDRLQQELQATTDHNSDLATQIQGHQARQVELENTSGEAIQKVDTLTSEAASARTKITELELTVDNLRHRLQTKDDDLTVLHAAIQEKEVLRASLVDQLSSLHSDHTAVKQTLTEKTEEAKALQAEVANLHNTSACLRKTINGEITQRATESAEYEDQISSLRDSVHQWEAQATQAAADAEVARSARQVTADDLQASQAHLRSVRQELATARTQVSSLTCEIKDASTRATDAQREIEDLRRAKVEGEKNILGMRSIFAGLREAQTRLFTEAEHQMVSAPSSSANALGCISVRPEISPTGPAEL